MRHDRHPQLRRVEKREFPKSWVSTKEYIRKYFMLNYAQIGRSYAAQFKPLRSA